MNQKHILIFAVIAIFILPISINVTDKQFQAQMQFAEASWWDSFVETVSDFFSGDSDSGLTDSYDSGPDYDARTYHTNTRSVTEITTRGGDYVDTTRYVYNDTTGAYNVYEDRQFTGSDDNSPPPPPGFGGSPPVPGSTGNPPGTNPSGSTQTATADIDHDPCVISNGTNFCTTNLNWTFTETSDPNVYNLTTQSSVLNPATSSESSFPYQIDITEDPATKSYIILARDGNRELNRTIIDPRCENGSWSPSGSICATTPTVSLTLESSSQLVVRAGSTVSLRYRADSVVPLDCRVSGPFEPGEFPITTANSSLNPTVSSVITSNPISFQTNFTLICTNTSVFPDQNFTSSRTVQVIPTVIEI